eukprot:TRINITY_DN1049_c0_g1_i1.p3 TRINITY_DN1049_c0_g1~~TRINITY_DN1049_c0_g1_i1.p3  ORF type:complete len:385 (+),score=43.27 TRINITY_DN1049_c0_g1_i1:1263-2417(+)
MRANGLWWIKVPPGVSQTALAKGCGQIVLAPVMSFIVRILRTEPVLFDAQHRLHPAASHLIEDGIVVQTLGPYALPEEHPQGGTLVGPVLIASSLPSTPFLRKLRHMQGTVKSAGNNNREPGPQPASTSTSTSSTSTARSTDADSGGDTSNGDGDASGEDAEGHRSGGARTPGKMTMLEAYNQVMDELDERLGKNHMSEDPDVAATANAELPGWDDILLVAEQGASAHKQATVRIAKQYPVTEPTTAGVAVLVTWTGWVPPGNYVLEGVVDPKGHWAVRRQRVLVEEGNQTSTINITIVQRTCKLKPGVKVGHLHLLDEQVWNKEVHQHEVGITRSLLKLSAESLRQSDTPARDSKLAAVKARKASVERNDRLATACFMVCHAR